MSNSATGQPGPPQDGADPESQAAYTQTPTQPEQDRVTSTQHIIPSRIAYLGLISVFAPAINFALNWSETAEMDVLFAVITWVAGGLVMSAWATCLLTPLCLVIVTGLIGVLEFIPALGISSWICVSTWFTSFLIRGPIPAYLNTPPLFVLAWINLSLSKSDFIRDHALRSFLHPSDYVIIDNSGYLFRQRMPRPFYMFENGQCRCQREETGSHLGKTYFTLSSLSVPDQASVSLRDMIQNGFYYVSGFESETFQEMFNAWQTHAQQVVANINRRRLLFLVGFLCEAVAAVCTVSLLGNMVGSHSVRYYTRPYLTSPLQFRWYQVTAALLFISFSDYLHLLLNTRGSFTSLTEVRALMLHCTSSRIFNWAKLNTSFLSNGRWLPGPKTLFVEKSIPVGELSLLGFVGDQNESDRANATVLRNTVLSTFVSLERGDGIILTVPMSSRENRTRQSSENGTQRLTLILQDMVG